MQNTITVICVYDDDFSQKEIYTARSGLRGLLQYSEFFCQSKCIHWKTVTAGKPPFRVFKPADEDTDSCSSTPSSGSSIQQDQESNEITPIAVNPVEAPTEVDILESLLGENYQTLTARDKK
nr:unnamed protein product [Callosobruchus analis]